MNWILPGVTALVLGRSGLGQLQDRLFAYLLRNSERAADYVRVPPSRVEELGAQVSI